MPYLEFKRGSDTFVGGNDGCNWFGAPGSLVGDRFALTETAMTAMDCGPGTGGVLPIDGDVVQLSADGSTMTLLDESGSTRLVYRRVDSLTPADATAMVGGWGLDEGSPSTIRLR